MEALLPCTGLLASAARLSDPACPALPVLSFPAQSLLPFPVCPILPSVPYTAHSPLNSPVSPIQHSLPYPALPAPSCPACPFLLCLLDLSCHAYPIISHLAYRIISHPTYPIISDPACPILPWLPNPALPAALAKTPGHMRTQERYSLHALARNIYRVHSIKCARVSRLRI